MENIIAIMLLAFQPSFVECNTENVLPIENNKETKQTNSQNLVFDEYWKRENKKK